MFLVRNRWRNRLILIFGTFALLYWSILRLVHLHCFSYFDLGIYSDALHRVSLSQLNPFIPGRNIRIFNDHFDPILILPALMEPLIPGPYLGITLDFLFIALCWLPLRLLKKEGVLSENKALFALVFLLFNPAMADALQWPFHPTTWACLPLFYVFTFWTLRRWTAMLASLCALYFFREEFPLLGLFLGAVLFFEKEKKPGLLALGISALWCVFLFLIRPKISENVSTYGSDLLSNFIHAPFAQLHQHLSFSFFRMWLGRLAPLLLLLNWAVFWRHRSHFLKVLIIAAPLFGIRYASFQWAFHYGTAPVIVLFFAALPALKESTVKPWRWFAANALLLGLFLSPVVKNIWDGYFSEDGYRFGHKRCPLDSTRLDEINQSQEWIAKSGKKKILLENNLAPTQMLKSPSQEIFILSGPQTMNLGPFEVVFVEKPQWGDPWPLGYERIEALIQIWKAIPGVTVIKDNEYVFLAEGKIEIER